MSDYVFVSGYIFISASESGPISLGLWLKVPSTKFNKMVFGGTKMAVDDDRAVSSQCPLVAILTPVYNGEKFLHETMQCVQNSDYPNLIHVVLDNASTDGTSAILDEFRDRRVPVQILRNSTTIPMCDNFNAVAAAAPSQAKYVRFLCADDLMESSAISKMVAVAEKDEKISLVGCQCRDQIGLIGAELPRDRQIFSGSTIVRAFLRDETRVFCGTHFLFRHDILKARKPIYDSSIDSMEDVDCAIAVAYGNHFGFVHEPLDMHRLHDESYSSRIAMRNGNFIFDRLLLLDRYGAKILEPDEYAQCRRLHRRHLLRRMILALLKYGDKNFFSLQMKRLAEIGDPANIGDFVVALFEWVCRVGTNQRNRLIAPRSMVLVPQVSPSQRRHDERPASDEAP